MSRLAVFLVPIAIVLVACAGGGVSPVDFDSAHEPCRFCRMTGSNGRSAAQIVAPQQEALYFDDIGCLRSYIKRTGAVPSGAAIYVADHQTGAWTHADRAIYTFNERIATPMSSHLLAHESKASHDADPDTRDGRALQIADVFSGVPVPWRHDQ
jgi:copper chaperone NosL